MSELLKLVTKMVDPRELFLPWIAAIVQLIVWPINILRYKKKGSNLEQDVQYWKEEVSKARNKANDWFQITKHALYILKDKAPEAYKDFVNTYGREEKFKDWYTLPEMPKEEEE
jgi:hypothetical protein